MVDIPVTATVLAKMKADTGIDYGTGTATAGSKQVKGREICIPSALPGHVIETATEPSSPSGNGNVFTQPLPWVALPRYLDWNTGGTNCQASISIRMRLGEMYSRIADPSDIGSTNYSKYFLLIILAVIGVCFLLIQIIAFISGLTLARSITGSVHELFTGTERVRLGDFTHKIPIKTRDQLGELAQSFNSMTRSIADLLQQKAEKERLEQELRIARNIQMSLLPREPVTLPGLAVTAHCEPAREVGGDYYDYMTVGEQRLGLLIADVSGKGTSAALYMAELKGLMLSLSQLYTSPRQLLINANAILSHHLDSRSFITITYAVVDVVQRTLTYARAGHCPLIYVPGPYAPSRAAQILAPDGLVLGLQIDDGGQRFTRLLQEVTVPLGTGDLFLFYTDGLTEAMDQEGNIFGDVRLGAVVQEHADAPFDELRDTILREIAIFSGPTAQQDDMTMLLLRVEEVGAGGRVVTQTSR
jgi:sigma-B regulation protein RsbU (phosphoserine phosphatase)